MDQFAMSHGRLALTASVLTLFAITLLPGSSAVAQRNLTDIPDPDPEIERASFIVAEGFEVNLFAADPMLAKPIQINFDTAGRLWVASSELYPHIEPGQKADDKILVLEDEDGDGTADTTTVFADGLLIPTGLAPGDGGCYVANSTELLYLADTDQDGAADFRRTVLSGFGTEDTHHLLHTLRWGPDGCLYMNQSIYIHSHVETPYGVRHLNGGGIWRFRPESMKLDVLCEGFVNPWGHHIDEWGQSFATDGAYREGINYLFPGSVFVAAPGAKRLMQGLNPGSPKHCGLEIVSGSHLPPDWQGNMLTNDFRANRVCRFVVTENGAGYSSRQEVELIKTNHVAFRPIDVKLGPDGAIYIADWYNPIIQHGEVDFRDPRRDHVHGRIWRVTAKGRPLVETPDIGNATIAELVELLFSDEPWIRQQAKQQLRMSPGDYVAGELDRQIQTIDPTTAEDAQTSLEFLWAYQGSHQPRESLLRQLLNNPDHRARAAAIRVAVEWRHEIEGTAALLATAAEDSHPRVRLEAVRGLAEIPSMASAQAVIGVIDKPVDRFLDFAIWRSMRDLSPVWLPEVNQGATAFGGNHRHLLYSLSAVDSPQIVPALLSLLDAEGLDEESANAALDLLTTHGGPNSLFLVLQQVEGLAAEQPESAARLLDRLQEICFSRGRIRPSSGLDAIYAFLESEQQDLQRAAAKAIGTWQLEPGFETLDSWFSRQPEQELLEAAIVAFERLGTERAKQKLVQIATGAESGDLRDLAIRSLIPLNTELSARLTAARFGNATVDQMPARLLSRLLEQQDGAKLFTSHLAEQSLDVDVAKILLRDAQRNSGSTPELIEQIRRSGSLDTSQWELDPALLSRLIASVEETGDPVAGETIYRRADLQCLNCHAIAGSGGNVGPDLVSVGASAPVDYLIESLIEPNSKIKENFHSKTILTLDGRLITGIPLSQTDGMLQLRQADGNVASVRESDVDEMIDGPSLMAKGLVDSLTEQELVDLTSFLSQLGKVGEFAVGNRPVIRNWESLSWTAEANRRLNRTSYDTASTDDAALTWQPAYSRVSGQLPIEPLAPFVIHNGYDPTSFVRFQFEVEQAGEIVLRFDNSQGIEVWIDEKPTPFLPTIVMNLDRGIHRVMLAINRQNLEQDLRVELEPNSNSAAQLRLP